MIWLCIIIAAVVGVALVFHHLRRPKMGRLHLRSGGVKMGKTAFCVRDVIRLHKKAVRKWKKGKRRFPDDPCPRLYSNMPIKGYQWYPLTPSIVALEERVPFGSVVYINEMSLFSGCMDVKDEAVNDAMNAFYKLCAHVTGGYVIVDTQNVMDSHFTCKRSLSSFWHIVQSLTIPFVGVLAITESREVVDTEIKSPSENADRRDAARDFVEWLLPRRIFCEFCPSSIWRRYDQYAYHALVADKPLADPAPINSRDGQMKSVVRVKDYIKEKKSHDKK